MADIIPLGGRINKKKAEVLSQEKKKRLDSFRTAMQCTSCPMKCAKCGSQLETPQQQLLSENLPLRLCQGCWEEYDLFRRMVSDPASVPEREFYHNQAWVGVWQTWLDYQKQLHEYRNTREFIKLIEELSQEP